MTKVKTVKAETMAHGIRVSDEVWRALNRLRQKHGSIDRALRAVLLKPASERGKTNGNK